MLEEKDFSRFIGDLVRKARHQKKFTLEDLAAESGLEYSTVNLIENGKQQAKLYTIYRIFCTLDVDIMDFLDGKKSRGDELLLVNKIRQLDDSQIETLNSFLSSFNLTKKK